MKLEDVRVGMKVVPHSKTVEGYEYIEKGYFEPDEFIPEEGYLIVTDITNYPEGEEISLDEESDVKYKNGIILGSGNYFRASDFELYIEQPQPVDLSTVKVGEKYVIGEIDKAVDSQCFSYYGKSIDSNFFKVGDIVEIKEDEDGFSCLYKDGKYSYAIRECKFKLYPYTESSEPIQEDLDDCGELLSESQEVSTESEYTTPKPTSDNIEYAKKYYNGYLKVARVYHRQVREFSNLLDEDDKINVLSNSIWWIDDCVQDKICKLLGINLDRVEIQDTVLDIFRNSFEDMEEFDTIIGRLKVEGIIE